MPKPIQKLDLRIPNPIQKLLLYCSGGCQEVIPVDFGMTAEALVDYLLEHGWFLSLMTPPGVRPIASAATCRVCADRLMPGVVKEYERIKKERQSKRNS